MKPGNILLIIIAVIGVFFLFKRNRTSVDSGKGVSQVAEHKEAVSLSAKDHTTKLTERNRQALRLESQLGMGRIALKRQGGRVVVPVNIDVESVCHPGDFDAIDMDMAKASDKTILVSLEPLNEDSDAKGKVIRLSYNKLKQARNIQIELSASIKSPEQFGIFVCSDSQGADSCRKKQSVDINEIFSYHILGEKGVAKPLPKDKMYFFQYAMLGQNYLSGFHQTPNRNFSYDKLAQLAQISGVKSNNIRGEIKATSQFNSTLESYAPKLTENQFSVRLPFYDQTKCK